MTVNSDAEDSHSEVTEEITEGVQTQVHTQCSRNRGGGGGRKAGILLFSFVNTLEMQLIDLGTSNFDATQCFSLFHSSFF